MDIGKQHSSVTKENSSLYKASPTPNDIVKNNTSDSNCDSCFTKRYLSLYPHLLAL